MAILLPCTCLTYYFNRKSKASEGDYSLLIDMPT